MKELRMLHIWLLLIKIYSIQAAEYCSHGSYGRPAPADCVRLISRLPNDKIIRFFVEQDLRTAPPQANWIGFADPRQSGYKQKIMQLPKWWSEGESYQVEESALFHTEYT